MDNISEENSKLLGNFYEVPEEVLVYVKHALNKHGEDNKTAKGYKRANHIVNNPNQPFVNLVNIKNYFDTLDTNNINNVEFDLHGGKVMNTWVQDLIKRERERVKERQTDKERQRSACVCVCVVTFYREGVRLRSYRIHLTVPVD